MRDEKQIIVYFVVCHCRSINNVTIIVNHYVYAENGEFQC